MEQMNVMRKGNKVDQNNDNLLTGKDFNNFNEEYIQNMLSDINQNKNNDGLFACAICEKKYGTTLGIRRHIVRSHSKEILLYKCEKCDQNFRTRTYLNQHKCSNKAKNLTSKLINSSYSQDDKLQNDELLQIYDKIKVDPDSFCFICPFCKVAVKKKNSFKYHLLKNHSSDDIPIKCPKCEIGFRNKSNLLAHMKSVKCKETDNEIFEELEYKNDNELNSKESIVKNFVKSRKSKRNSNQILKSAIEEDEEVLYSCAKCSNVFSSKIEIREHILKKDCDSINLKEIISTTKQKYMKTLKILKKAKLHRQKLKQKLIALGENFESSDSESDTIDEMEVLLNLIENDNDNQHGDGKVFKHSKFSQLQTYNNTEKTELETKEETPFEGNNEIGFEIPGQYVSNLDEYVKLNSYETYSQDFYPQNGEEFQSKESNLENIKIEVKEEHFEEEFLIDTSSNEFETVTENDERLLHINFVHDLSTENHKMLEVEFSDYIDESVAEEWIEVDDENILPQNLNNENNHIESPEVEKEITDTKFKEKYNEKYMSFLYKSLMKEELERDKIRKDSQRNNQQIQMISSVEHETQILQDSRAENDFLNIDNANALLEDSENLENLNKNVTHVRSHDDNTILIQNISKYECSFCDKKFDTKSKLDTHNRLHTTGTSFKCSYCERKCYDRVALEIHERRHTNDRRYKCEFCNEHFFTVFEKKRHQITWHQSGSKRKLENVGSLRHLMSYDQKRKFGPKALLGDDGLYHCKMCYKVCLTAKTMRKHTALHLNGKPCPKCSKVFAYESTLKRHLLTPHEDKNFMCTVCGNRYISAASLKSHSKVHSENAMTCPICPKIFGTIYNFDRHMFHKHKLKNWQEIYKDIIFVEDNKSEEE